MSDSSANQPFKLDRPPIVETVVDIDCDLPPDRPLTEIESEAAASLHDDYPNLEKKFFQQVHIEVRKSGTTQPPHQVREGLEGLLLRSRDGRQLTQFRAGGYSFNRLAPYEGLDTYLPEIKRTWENYSAIARPVSLRKIGLRTINRISLPLDEHGRLKLGDYLATDPRLPGVAGKQLSFTGFMNQHKLRDEASGQEATIVLASKGRKDGHLILLVDIDAFDRNVADLKSWQEVHHVVQSLRGLKNGLFFNTLTEKCLKQF